MGRLALLAAAIALTGPVAAETQWRWSGVDRIVAFADVHGAHDELVGLLQKTGVIDRQLQWSGGKTHLVSTGDLVDRGGQSRAVMDLLMRLQPEAAAAGGQVHVLLGNHELMNLTGDRRYVSEQEYLAFAGEEPTSVREQALAKFISAAISDQTLAEAEFNRLHPPGYFGLHAAFAPDGKYGNWLLDRPLLIVINRTAFTHGGLPPAVAARGLEQTNRILGDELDRFVELWHQLQDSDLVARETDARESARLIRQQLAIGQTSMDQAQESLPPNPSAEFLLLSESDIFDDDGPLWYRGSALCHPLLETHVISAVLESLDADRVVVGHTPTADHRAGRRMDDRVIVMDTGMLHEYYEGVPAALVLEGGSIDVVYGRSGIADVVADDESQERLLRESTIVSHDPETQRVILEENRLGVFTPRLSNPEYKNEIAAYRLDRLLGLNLIPVTVERKLDGRKGALSLRPADAINENERQTAGRAIPSWCSSGTEFDLMYAFDALVYNEGRTRASMLYTGPNLSLRIVSFTRAFSTRRGIPEYLANAELGLAPELVQRLADLDYDTLNLELKGLLSKGQIRALLKRRDEMLDTWPRL